MTQISRPIQIALLAVFLLAAVWAVALRGHSKTESIVVPQAPATTATVTPANGSSSASATKSKGSSAPGVAGLTRAVEKAHGAVKTSETNAKGLEQKSAAASGEASKSDAASGGTSASKPSTAKSEASAKTNSSSSAATKTKTTPSTSAASKSAAGAPARQQSVEKALSSGKIAVILFWNPNGSDDVAVHHELQLLSKAHTSMGSKKSVPQKLEKTFGRELNRGIAVFESRSAQVATFGTITRGVQVYGTPTILIVNKQGQTTTLTGLQDGYAIQQAINEARHS